MEEKLIKYGENVKIKRAEKKLNNIKEEENKYTFKPDLDKTLNSNLLSTFKINSNFYERQELYKTRLEKKLEKIKNDNPDPHLAEYTFKPQLTELAKTIKRTRDDLYQWKDKKDYELRLAQEIKQKKELEEIEINSKKTKINKNSEKIVIEKKDRNNYEPEDDNNEEQLGFDLWPAHMEKNYFQK